MQFRDFLALIWKRRLVVLVAFLACVVASAAYGFSRAKRYSSSTTIVFTPNSRLGQQFLPPPHR